MEVFETVDGVIYADVALIGGGIRFRAIVLYECNRVSGGIAVESIFPDVVVGETGNLLPLVVTIKVLVVLVLIQTDGLGRIHIGRCTYGTIVPAALSRHDLT